MPDGATALHDFFGKEAGDFFAIPLLKASLLFSPGEPFSRQMEEWQSPIFAEKGRYASGEYIGEGRCQNLKMGLLPGTFWLLSCSVFGATVHAAVHDAAHDAFMTLPAYTRTREGEVQLVVNRLFPLAFFARSVKLLLYILE